LYIKEIITLLKKMKKLPSLQLAVLLFAATLAVVVGACSDEFVISGKMPGILVSGEQVPGGQEGPKTPLAEHYKIENLNQSPNNIKAVNITPKSDETSRGKVTVYYDNSTTLPTQIGTYAVTFNVAAANGWKAAAGLSAGELIIGDPEKQTPVAPDYNISTNLNQTAGSVTAVTVTAKSGKSTGAVTVYYAGTEGTTYTRNTTLPSAAGTYAVTFDVAEASGWNAASGLSAGTLTIKGTPVAGDFDIGKLSQTAGSVTAVTITPKSGKSTGAVSIKYAGNTAIPQTAGSYAVTFDVAAAGVWNAASGLSAGTLNVSVAGAAKNYISGPDALGWGVSTTNAPTYLGLTPGDTTSEVRLTWDSSQTQTRVRFIKGTATAGTQLIEVTGTTSSSNHKAVVTGLEPGASYEYAVSSDGNNWSKLYSFAVPAAGPFKFAVISDPQISSGNVDKDSRYPATNVTTAAGWKETMDIISTKGVSLIVSAGDQVDTSNSTQQYTSLFAPDGMKSLPFAPVIGNHDTNALFFTRFNIPNEKGTANSTSAGASYYYLYNNILFVGLNTSGSSSTTQQTLFTNTINAAKTAHAGKYDWLIVQHHKSTASVGDHCADTDIQKFVEDGFEKKMSDLGVDFVLAGHDHVYARSYPLQGLAGGKVSVPDKSAGITNTYTNPGKPIYLTFTTASGLKYYAVSSDPYFKYADTLYVKNNASYPYLGDVTNAAGDGSTQKGSVTYMTGNYKPVSNLAFVQPYIPSYTIVEVNGKTIKFSTYPIATRSGTNAGAAQSYSFNKDTAYDWVQVTKN
jgi:hypothetical protein